MALSDYSGECSFDGCERPISHKTWQLCNAHKLQRSRGKELRPIIRTDSRPVWGTQQCSMADCAGALVARGLCENHYRHAKRNKPDLYPTYISRVKDRTVRDEQGYKLCVSCREWKSEDDFGTYDKAADRLRHSCRSCLAARARESHLRRAYKLTSKKFDEMLKSQGGLCALCKESSDNPRWAVDHDHSCCPGEYTCGNCVRAILCHVCNLQLGVFENKSFGALASAYLDRFPKSIRELGTA